MKLTKSKLTKIRPAFEAIILSLRAFWQKHRRLIGWTIGLTLLALLATILFVWLWRRSQLFRTLVLIVAAAMAANSNRMMNRFTKQATELQEAGGWESPISQEILDDAHEAEGDEIPQGSEAEPEPMPV